MSCPSVERIAAAASGEDEVVAMHAEDCDRCRGLLAEQADVVALAKRLPAPPLVGARRRTLEALVHAHADAAPLRRRSRWRTVAPILVVAAAVAVTVIAVGPDRGRPSNVRVFEAPVVQLPPRPAPVAAPKPPDIVAADADYVRDHQVVQLHAGKLAIDTRGGQALEVVSRDASVRVADASVEIVARKGAIAMVHVFAGSAQLTVSGRRVIVAAGDVWEPAPPPPRPRVEPPPAPEPPPTSGEAIDPTPVAPTSSVERSLAEFRTGWTALRGGFNADAIAAFDRATDPVVAEDALYWAAVASERAGDRDGAIRRFRAFVERFPNSPRTDGARAALKRLDR